MGLPKGGRVPNTAGGVEDLGAPHNGFFRSGEGWPLHGGKRGPAGLYPCQGAPIDM